MRCPTFRITEVLPTTTIHINISLLKIKMKYAHLADAHLGAWREPKMRDLSMEAFLTAIDDCLKQEVDFILFAGDLFNTSLPSLDILKTATHKLKELNDKEIPFYAIAGSHDFSPSGKTMIDVLEKAGLLINVSKGSAEGEAQLLRLSFTIDQKTGAKITGILGRKGQLDWSCYENLDLSSLEQEPGYKIFLFHTTLTELKPKDLEKVESRPASLLPKGFNYYAGGHVHHPVKIELDGYGPLAYPGALFPTDFGEVEKYGHGGYYLISAEGPAENYRQKVEWRPVKVRERHSLILDCRHRTPEAINTQLREHFEQLDIEQGLVTIRLAGKIEQGKISNINFKEIFQQVYSKGAYFVMKNTSQLISPEFEEIKIVQSSPELMEEELIKEHLQQNKLFEREKEFYLTKALLAALNTAKKEGETMADFQTRVESEINQLLEID